MKTCRNLDEASGCFPVILEFEDTGIFEFLLVLDFLLMYFTTLLSHN